MTQLIYIGYYGVDYKFWGKMTSIFFSYFPEYFAFKI